jgi:TatD DNase family protein
VIPSSLVDTHCHLDLSHFDVDRGEVIERARQTGVVRIVNPAINISSSYSILEFAENVPQWYAAIGVHPNEASSLENFPCDQIKSLLSHPKVVAVGEIGLDYYRNKSARAIQIEIFEKQLQLAEEVGLPIIVHNRDASKDILDILTSWKRYLRTDYSSKKVAFGVLHSFSGTLEEAFQFSEMGFKIGITGPVTFPKALGLQEIVVQLPLENLLIETDAPFLTPHPFRGRRNEPSLIHHIVAKIANLRKMDFVQVAEVTTTNANQLFNWRDTF